MLAGRIEPSQPTQSQVEETSAAAGLPDEIDAARAREYALLARLLTRTPDRQLLNEIAGVKVDASPLGLAHAACHRPFEREIKQEAQLADVSRRRRSGDGRRCRS